MTGENDSLLPDVVSGSYPVIWIAGPNATGLMDVETTALVVAYIDIVSKVGLGLIALNGYTVAASAVADRTSTAD